MSLFWEAEVPNTKSPVTGSMATPSAPASPNKKSRWAPGTGSPFPSKGAITILSLKNFAIRTLLAENPGNPAATKAMPSASPTLVRRVAELRLNVPLPSGVRLTLYQSPLGKETSFILPAPENPGGTKPTEPTDEVTPSGVRLVTLFGKPLPGLLCSS